MEELTVRRLDYPPHIRALDAIAGPFGRLTGLSGLDADEILATSRRNTGLHDWGDEHFLPPMRLVVDNATRLGFTNLARIFIRATYQKAVVNRLRLQAALKADPQIAATEVRKPIFVLGFPRSGTTLLQNLLAQVPSRRGLRFWELITPLPVHADPAIDRQRRIRTADWALRAGYFMAPEMGQVHAIGSETLEECWYLFCNSFAVLNWDLQTGLDDYGRWLLQADLTPAYSEYRTWLQVLLRHHPAENLLLKCPEHLWFIDALLEVFPDACIVWTHRDPLDSIASYASMMTLPRRMMYGKVDPKALGGRITERFHEGVERAMSALDKADPARFHHVNFDELIRDPKAVVHRIVQHFDLDDPPDHDARLDAWLSQKRQDERGQHVYDGRVYGIDAADVDARFRGYTERFGITPKGRRS